MEFNTTPLPWSLDCDGDLMAADRTLVAIIPSAKDRPLLAAAPEMLECLQATIDYLGFFATPAANELWGKVSEVMRKATGQESK